MSESRLVPAAALALLTVLCFLPVLGYGFVQFDDPLYVTANPAVQAGITRAGLAWAATARVAGNWHPLTLLSHMLDCQLFGLNPRGHHLTSLLLHTASVLLLFSLLRRLTGRPGRSFVVAALFAVHPTRLESVAWVAERKDVLSGLLFLLTIAAYVHYVRRPGAGRHLLVMLAYGLGLAAKPMLVTLPFVLLLLDVWPLARLTRRALLEKLPLLALSIVAGAIALAMQSTALAREGALPLSLRLANVLVSYARYLRQAIWPSGLAAFYPYPLAIPLWQPVAAGLLLAGISVLAWRWRARAPYLAVGWGWFLGMLVPVIGLVQVGKQGYADRYTYLPFIGLFLACVWGLSELLARAGAPLATAALLLCAVSARAQMPQWHDSVALFERAIAVTAGNYLAHLNLAEELRRRGEVARALEHYRAAIRLRPRLAVSYAALGVALRSWGQPRAALAPLATAIRLDPRDARAHLTLAMALDDLDRTPEAIAQLRAALALDPGLEDARRGLQALSRKLGCNDRQPLGGEPHRGEKGEESVCIGQGRFCC